MISRQTRCLCILIVSVCMLAALTGCGSNTKNMMTSLPAAQSGSSTSGTAETTTGNPTDSSHTDDSSYTQTGGTPASANGPAGATGGRTTAAYETSRPVVSQTKAGSIGTLLMNQPSHGSMAASDKPTFTWLEASNAESYTFRLELLDEATRQ